MQYIHTYDSNERAMLEAVFKQNGFTVHAATDLHIILEQWSDQPADLLITAQHPANLLESVNTIRSVIGVPLVVISYELSEDTQITLYQGGVDLVIIRPYSMRLFVHQMYNLAQRGRSVHLTQLPQIQIGSLRVDPTTRTASKGDMMQVHLTHREFQLLYLLDAHKGQVLEAGQLIEKIWGYTGQGDKNALRNLVRKLRAKLDEHTDEESFIETISNIGYRLR